MRKLLAFSILSILLLSTGCVESMPNLLGSNLNPDTQQAITFKTNQVNFMHSLKNKSNRDERNSFLDEFVLKSDIQCQNYLNSPLKQNEPTDNQSSLYMNIFDTVSGLFGMGLVTNTAKAVFLDNGDASTEEKEAYANALSPEIRKGVEIGRIRYAKGMNKKKILNLQQYSVNNLREDTLKYDKQCNDAYGLIEINRALKEMQSAVYTKSIPTAAALKIDPRAIKAKVEAVSKKVEEKQEIKKKQEIEKKNVL